MMLMFEKSEYVVVDHELSTLDLRYKVANLKQDMIENKAYVLLRDDENMMESWIGIIKRVETTSERLVVSIHFFDDKYTVMMKEIDEMGLCVSLNSLVHNNELLGLGVTPCPTEIYP